MGFPGFLGLCYKLGQDVPATLITLEQRGFGLEVDAVAQLGELAALLERQE